MLSMPIYIGNYSKKSNIFIIVNCSNILYCLFFHLAITNKLSTNVSLALQNPALLLSNPISDYFYIYKNYIKCLEDFLQLKYYSSLIIKLKYIVLSNTCIRKIIINLMNK